MVEFSCKKTFVELQFKMKMLLILLFVCLVRKIQSVNETSHFTVPVFRRKFNSEKREEGRCIK